MKICHILLVMFLVASAQGAQNKCDDLYVDFKFYCIDQKSPRGELARRECHEFIVQMKNYGCDLKRVRGEFGDYSNEKKN